MSSEIRCQVETSILNSILIDCCVVFLQENSSEEKILGSGTLISIHDKKAILTADHVLEKIEQPSGCGRLFFPTRFDNSPQSTPRASTQIPMKYLEKRTVGRGEKKDKGPDLGLLLVPDAIKSQFFPSTKTFYNLTSRRRKVLEDPCPIEDELWTLVGAPDKLTVTAEPEAGFETVKGQPVLIGLGIVNKEYERDNFDYLEFSLNFNAGYAGPTWFGGCSGGSLWHLRLEQNESGKAVIHDPILSGVVFYQSDPKDDNPIIRCHGRKSIYQKLLEAI